MHWYPKPVDSKYFTIPIPKNWKVYSCNIGLRIYTITNNHGSEMTQLVATPDQSLNDGITSATRLLIIYACESQYHEQVLRRFVDFLLAQKSDLIVDVDFLRQNDIAVNKVNVSNERYRKLPVSCQYSYMVTLVINWIDRQHFLAHENHIVKTLF